MKILEADAMQGRENEKRKGKLSAWMEKNAAKKQGKDALAKDLLAFAVGLLFAGSHLFFGAYPLGLGFLCVLPECVFPALFGVAVGSLSLGKTGVVFALCAGICCALRILISGFWSRDDEKNLFGEPLLLRMASALLGGFVSAVYRVAVGGLNTAGILFGLTMILLPPLFVFAFSGLFDAGIGFSDFLYGKRAIFGAAKEKNQTYARMLFEGAALLFAFFLAKALSARSFFGILPGFVFAGAATLFAAKRFGALRAAAVGFTAALAVSVEQAAGFALAGLLAGLLSPFGLGYAIVGGSLAVGGWSYAVGQVSGMLSVLPEFFVAAVVVFPLLKAVKSEKYAADKPSASVPTAADMVGTMALAYQGKTADDELRMEGVFCELGDVVKRFGEQNPEEKGEVCRKLFAVQLGEKHLPVPDPIHPVWQTIGSGSPLTAEALGFLPGGEREAFAEMYNRLLQIAFSESDAGGMRLVADELSLIGNLFEEARERENRRRRSDRELSGKLENIFADHGFSDGAIRIFGDRKRHLIAAGEDADGTRITSPTLRRALEEQIGLRLGTPSYYRRENMVLMECETEKKYAVRFAVASSAGREGEISGDKASCFFCEDGRFFALLSDGMGSGETAAQTSGFTVEFLQKLLKTGTSGSGGLALVNSLIRARRRECPATVDLFSFDLFLGEAVFLKSGAAPSYVKRGSTLFRIRSRTVPIGSLDTVDAEKIQVEVLPGDTVFLFSDGISSAPEDAPWLLSLLGRHGLQDPAAYAKRILSAAEANVKTADDKSVIVIRVENAPQESSKAE